jgi:predicted Zn-dependent protease
MGQLHLARSEPAKAREAFERALRLSPLDRMTVWARAGIADVDIMENRLKEALRLYRQCLSERPKEGLFRRRVCALLALTGEKQEARRMANEIRVDDPQLTLDRVVARSPLLPKTFSRQDSARTAASWLRVTYSNGRGLHWPASSVG